MAEGLLALLLIGATAGAYRFPIRLHHRIKVQMASVPYYLMAALLPPPLAAVAAGLAAAIGELSVRAQRGNTAGDVAGSVGRRAVLVLLGALVAHVPAHAPAYAVVLIAAAAVMGVGDIVTCPLILGPILGQPPLRIMAMAAQEAYLVESGQYLLGVLGALAATRQLWALALLALPTALIYLAFQAIARAEQAQDVAEKALRVRDEFLTAASHDLRTPLTAILGHAGLMQMRLQRDDGLDKDWLDDQVSILSIGATRMLATVEEITDVAQLQMGQTLTLHMDRVDLGEMVRSAIAIVRAGTPYRSAPIKLVVNDEIVVLGDHARLERVMQNIIGNALKYSPRHSPVTVTVGRADGWANITVTDQGVGIPAEELPHIFAPFFRASTAIGVKGTGIGLSGAKTIVEQHGGQIEVDSAVGQGTTVTVRLPMPAGRAS